MADHHDPSSEKTTAPNPTPSSAVGDAENPTPVPIGGGSSGRGGVVSSVLSRWKREDLLKKISLASRGFGLVFSLLAFIIMASNKHGDWKNFDNYGEYKYLLAIAILSTLYTGFQTLRDFHEIYTGRETFSHQNTVMLNFFADQIVAYLLLSAASSAVPLTNRMRENNDNIFTDSSASAISMTFLAFLSVAVSAVISGYRLCKQTYI